MNYYERHLGDYARDTAHLSMTEHGAYTLLLDRYYSTESPIPSDQAHRLARARTKEERAAVDSVLEEFFVLQDGAWRHGRCEEEIEKAQARIRAAQENGRRGGRPKKATNPKQTETEEKPGGLSLGSDLETQQKTHQTPDTRHQTPEEDSVPIGTGAAAPMPSWDASEMTKDELWTAGKSLLCEAGIPAKQCGSFVGKLIKDYGDAVVIAAVRAAVVARPADPVQYLKAVCMRSVGQRSPPNRQEAVEARNRSVAIDWLQKHGAQA